MNASDITVLIPAAGRVPEGVIALSNIACPAMIPVAGRPVIHWTMRSLRALGLRRFRIAVASRGMFVEDFVECAFGADSDVEFLVPRKQAGLGQTVLDLLEGTTTRAALVVLGDTHFELSDPGALGGARAFVVTSEVEDSYRWCTAEVDAAGYVTTLHDKVVGRPSPCAALVGVYYFPDVVAARDAAREAVGACEAAGAPRTEMADVLRAWMTRAPLHTEPAGLWADVGNPDRLATSQRTLLSSRAFNSLSVDPILGTITKTSRNADKLLDEIRYLRALPPDLAVLFPRLLSASEDPTSPSVTLEYYGYPTLAEVFLFEGVDPSIWRQVFEHLVTVVERGFRAHPLEVDADALFHMCVTKTRERLVRVQGPPELLRLINADDVVRVNGKPLRSVNALWGEIEDRVRTLSVSGSVIHGDMCFSNVLYDLRTRIVKLIDPRGRFGAPGIAGDVRYDIAKLYHSVAGHYDFIVNDLFRVEVSGEEVELEIRRRPHHDEIKAHFEAVFFQRFDAREITLITGLLFASMLPLHAESPRRQLAMFTRALQLLNDAVMGA